MKPPQARIFLEGVLLDAIREDIRLTREGARKNKNHRKLNVHYYEAMRRALYKPAAFFKGIVFPLLQVRLMFDVFECLSSRQSLCPRMAARCKKQPLLPLSLRKLKSLFSTPPLLSFDWPTWTTLVCLNIALS